MGRDKARLVWQGRRMIDRAVDHLAIACDRVVVAAGPHRRLGGHGADLEVGDPPGLTGPLAGIVAGLEATAADYVAIVAVDHPEPALPVLVRLADLCHASGRSGALPVVAGVPQPLHSVVARPAAPALSDRARAGHRSVRGAFGWLDAVLVGPDGWVDLDPTAGFALDWDRPDDFGHIRSAPGSPVARWVGPT
jgi:molybdopterin-guanine dinucleotide biosynthesis protein A